MMTSEMIKAEALRLGAQDCGIAGIERFADAPEGFRPHEIDSRCKSVAVIFKQMPAASVFPENPVPYTHAAYQMYAEMDHIAMELLRFCAGQGVGAVLVPADVPYLFWDNEEKIGRGILSLKHAAVKTGLGMMGRSTLFIHPKYGNMGYLGAILIAQELESDPLMQGFSCPDACHRCMDACPQKAIKEGHVNQKLCREHSFFQAGRGWDLYNCNECRKQCPLRLGKGK